MNIKWLLNIKQNILSFEFLVRTILSSGMIENEETLLKAEDWLPLSYHLTLLTQKI